jgi:putative transposase
MLFRRTLCPRSVSIAGLRIRWRFQRRFRLATSCRCPIASSSLAGASELCRVVPCVTANATRNALPKKMRRAAALHARAARIRRDWHHKQALDIARSFGAVGLEDLKITNITASAKGTVEKPGRNVRQKAGLNRSILEQGWGGFEIILGYKLEERGGTLTLVPASYSSQECFPCGHTSAKNRKSQAVFECVACGHRDHADLNSAKVLERRRNTALLDVEGRQLMSPYEASTRKAA